VKHILLNFNPRLLPSLCFPRNSYIIH